MEKIKLLFFIFVLYISQKEILQEKRDNIYSQKDIITDSEITFVEIPAGFIIWKEKGEAPNRFKYAILCQEGKVLCSHFNIWYPIKYEETIKRKVSLTQYLKLWQEIIELHVWDLESKTVFIDAQNGEEHMKKFLEMYDEKKLSLEASIYVFKFRIKDKEHKFAVMDIDGLKDKRYKMMLEKIVNFFTKKCKIKRHISHQYSSRISYYSQWRSILLNIGRRR
jgi:hypothetical protein